MQSIRQNLLNQRKTLSLFEQRYASDLITEKARQIPLFKESVSIAFYQATSGEVHCTSLMTHAWQKNKSVLLPVLYKQMLQFVHYQPNHSLTKNQYGIQEPISKNTLETSHIDLVFVPLLAFDTQMNRIGMGKGYYDRTFHFLQDATPKKRPILIGLAYEFQKVQKIKPNSWDIPLDQVITERQIYSYPL